MYNKKDEEKTFAVYCHYFPNGKVYVGLTCHCEDIEEKRFGHGGIKYKKQSLMYRAIQKYGWDNIQHVIIANYVSRESAVSIEKDLIALYKSNEREHGYNISPGGEEGSYHSEESRKKMSEQRKGVKKTEEHRRKIGESNKGKKISEEFRRKLSEISKNRHYDTTNDPRNTLVLQYDIQTGELVARYRSFSEAARQTGASRPHINECAKDKRRQELNCIWIYESMASEEYVQKRLHDARLHSLYKPVVLSHYKDFSRPFYCESKAMAAKFLREKTDVLKSYINRLKQCHGYFLKEVSIDEYINIMNNT